MSHQPELHNSIVAMVSLASGIAANHPAMGQCQLERLRKYGVPEHQIDAVIEIARHIRDEASEKLDAAFNELHEQNTNRTEADIEAIALPPQDDKQAKAGSCCTPTPSGQSCC